MKASFAFPESEARPGFCGGGFVCLVEELSALSQVSLHGRSSLPSRVLGAVAVGGGCADTAAPDDEEEDAEEDDEAEDGVGSGVSSDPAFFSAPSRTSF